MTHIDILGPAQFAAETANFDGVVMVDFWAARCGPCRMLAPVLHQITEDAHGKVKLLKIDVDEDQNQPLAMQFGVSSIPQVTFFVGGEKVDQFVGVQGPDSVSAIIEKHMPTTPVVKMGEDEQKMAA